MTKPDKKDAPPRGRVLLQPALPTDPAGVSAYLAEPPAAAAVPVKPPAGKPKEAKPARARLQWWLDEKLIEGLTVYAATRRPRIRPSEALHMAVESFLKAADCEK